MKSHLRRALPVLAAGAMVVAAGISTAGQAAAAPPSSATSALSAAEVKLLNSDAPKTVKLSPTTGAILSVDKGISRVDTRIGKRNLCNSGDACWYTTQTPYAHFGFYGSPGTYTASMPYRGDYHTGNYRASACWTYQGSSPCRGALPPNTYASLGVTVTGTSFRIH
ncbi:hypothetical protein ABT354_31170 [Streptomyces sp. NPDC000594]|uniref:hypothetical protein n=1 Tax=Streptomyces sp. NPDC000594 TaxID=3154261 RepID=UPI003320C364